jgi:hypothetical protein
MQATSAEGSLWRHIDQRGLFRALWSLLWSGYSFCHCMLCLVAASLAPRYFLPNHPPTHPWYSRGFYLVVCRYFRGLFRCFFVFFFIVFNLTGNRMYRPLYIVFRFHWLVSVTGAGGMPWQNCHGYLFLLLILLIVALIVAAQLLWQYFLPSRLVAALDHKRHLPPNTNTLPLNVVKYI